MRSLLFRLALLGSVVARVVLAQSPGQVTAQPGNLAGLLFASSFGQWQVPQGNAGQFSWSNANFCKANADGFYLNPVFSVGTPITIVDAVPANTETVIPTAVSVTGSGCSITVNPTHPHLSFYLTSGTGGLQEAINFARNLPYQVVVTSDWTRLGGATGMLTAAINGSNVGVVDWRTNCPVPYSWSGSAYAAGTSWCSGGGSTVVEVNGVPISPVSPANFVDTASVTWAFTGGQIEATSSGSGCIPGGNTGVFLYDNGAGGCSENYIDYGATTPNTLSVISPGDLNLYALSGVNSIMRLQVTGGDGTAIIATAPAVGGGIELHTDDGAAAVQVTGGSGTPTLNLDADFINIVHDNKGILIQGDASTLNGAIQFYEGSSDDSAVCPTLYSSTQVVQICAPSVPGISPPASYTMILPSAQGSGALTNDGAGNLSWTPNSGGVTSINTVAGAFTFSFSSGAGSCSGTTCTFTGSGSGGGSVTNFIASSGSWPTWLVPSVATSTTTPTLSVSASAIPNSALANSATTVNGQTCTLGSTCTIPNGSSSVFGTVKVDNTTITASAGVISAVSVISSVSNSDSTLTITPTTGAVVASLNLTHANTWSALQTYSAGINLSGASSPLEVGGSAGTSGYCFLSAGAGATPTWGVCPGGSSTVWSALTSAAGNLSLSNAAYSTTFNQVSTGSGDLFKWADGGTGTGILGHFTVGLGSSEIALQADVNGLGWRLGTDGSWQGVGSSPSHGLTVPGGSPLSGVASTLIITTNSSGQGFENENNTGSARICTALNAASVTGCQGAGSPPGGSSGQVQFNNAGAFGGFTVGGDATLNTGTGALTVTKSNGTSFGTAAFVNTGTSGGTVPLLNTLDVFSGGIHYIKDGSASFSPIYDTGTPFTGGSATTNWPQVYFDYNTGNEPSWDAAGAGTLLGINAPSGFTGALIDSYSAGTEVFEVYSNGNTDTLGYFLSSYGFKVTGGAEVQLYRCTTAGALRVGQVTSVAADCGASNATGVYVN